MKKIITMGESLVDFVPNSLGKSLRESQCYTLQAGGAPANVACAVARLGGEAHFITKLGKDPFGEFLYHEYKRIGVQMDNIYWTTKAHTGVAFVSLDEMGERDFVFYRNPSADMLLNAEEIDPDWFNHSIFHFGSIGLMESPMKYAHYKAVDCARKRGFLTSIDPNVRRNLWKNEEECRTAVKSLLTLCDIVKVSSEEVLFITENENLEKGIKELFQGRNQFVLCTKGANGATLHTHHFEVTHPGFPVNVVDSTGAGDAFMGAFLYRISQSDKALEDYGKEELYDILAFSNAVGAICVSKRGAISSLPTLEEVQNFIASR